MVGMPTSECIDHGKVNVVGIGYTGVWYNGKQERLHRVVYAIEHGVNVRDLDVIMHTCDNPRCINPKHLVHGTQQDNMTDKVRKGRHSVPSGEACTHAILTYSQVQAIRDRYVARSKIDGTRAIARELGVSQMTISDIVRHKTWRI